MPAEIRPLGKKLPAGSEHAPHLRFDCAERLFVALLQVRACFAQERRQRSQPYSVPKPEVIAEQPVGDMLAGAEVCVNFVDGAAQIPSVFRRQKSPNDCGAVCLKVFSWLCHPRPSAARLASRALLRPSRPALFRQAPQRNPSAPTPFARASRTPNRGARASPNGKAVVAAIGRRST